jgi:antibiotic biosynthesis monooxygenase (ABM) superfamily enzyme
MFGPCLDIVKRFTAGGLRGREVALAAVAPHSKLQVMIRHVVLVTMKPETDERELEAIVEAAKKLPTEIPSLREIEVGLGTNPGNATFGIVALFDDMDGFQEYMKHPAHKSFGQDHIVPVVESATQIQFQIQ